MKYYFDILGHPTDVVDEDRCTEVAPPGEAPEGFKWKWTFTEWILVSDAPVVAPTQPEPEWAWYIDIGPFFDRFGSAKMAVLTSADIGVQAILKDIQVRKWIDLRLPEVAQSLVYVGSKVAAVTPTLQSAILDAKPAPSENLALRKLYFSA